MSATERLRRLLDERGVEYSTHGERHGTWYDTPLGGRVYVAENNAGYLHVKSDAMTPEQAIAATLGATDARPTQAESSGTCHPISCNCTNDCTNSERTGTCHNASKVMDEHGQARFACSECGAWIDSRMLWNPEYRNGESPWVNDCKLNYCPNCGRRIVDPATNDVDAEVDA